MEGDARSSSDEISDSSVDQHQSNNKSNANGTKSTDHSQQNGTSKVSSAEDNEFNEASNVSSRTSDSTPLQAQ